FLSGNGLKHVSMYHIGQAVDRAFLVEFAASSHIILRDVEDHPVNHESGCFDIDFPGQTSLVSEEYQLSQFGNRSRHHCFMASSKVGVLDQKLAYYSMEP